MPPGPISVTKRWVLNMRAASAKAASRPTIPRGLAGKTTERSSELGTDSSIEGATKV